MAAEDNAKEALDNWDTLTDQEKATCVILAHPHVSLGTELCQITNKTPS